MLLMDTWAVKVSEWYGNDKQGTGRVLLGREEGGKGAGRLGEELNSL